MAQWMLEWNLGRVLRAGRHRPGPPTADAKLPGYLRRQQHEIATEEALR